MRTLVLALCAALAALLFAAPAAGDMTFTVSKDSTMDDNAGQIVRITEPWFAGESYFGFVDGDDMVRIYAHRIDSDGSWEIPLDPVYLVPSTTITAGQTWSGLPLEGAPLTVAAAIMLESVTTGAGSFLCWRVDLSPLGAPGNVLTSFWFAADVGMVAQVEYESGKAVWRVTLDSYSVTGSGYFPLEPGNTWDYLGEEVADQPRSLGALKSRFAGQATD